jgi:hypothetical protein
LSSSHYADFQRLSSSLWNNIARHGSPAFVAAAPRQHRLCRARLRHAKRAITYADMRRAYWLPQRHFIDAVGIALPSYLHRHRLISFSFGWSAGPFRFH